MTATWADPAPANATSTADTLDDDLAVISITLSNGG